MNPEEIIRIAELAGRKILEIYNRDEELRVMKKGDNSPLHPYNHWQIQPPCSLTQINAQQYASEKMLLQVHFLADPNDS